MIIIVIIMEKSHGMDFKGSIFISEMLGTMMLSMVMCTVWTENNLVSITSQFNIFLIMATGLYVVYNIFAPISGGHFNPIITLGVYLGITLNAANLALLALIFVAQLIGALIGCALSRALRIKTDALKIAPQTYPYYPYSTTFYSPIAEFY